MTCLLCIKCKLEVKRGGEEFYKSKKLSFARINLTSFLIII